MAGQKQYDSPWRAMAAARWLGYQIQGDGCYACVCTVQATVFLYRIASDANARQLERRWTREVYHLQMVAPAPRVWEKDQWDVN